MRDVIDYMVDICLNNSEYHMLNEKAAERQQVSFLTTQSARVVNQKLINTCRLLETVTQCPLKGLSLYPMYV